MDIFSKNKVLFWLLIVLIVVNLSAIATFFIVRSYTMITREQKARPACGADIAFRDRLHLNGPQQKQFHMINQQFIRISAPTVQALRLKQSELVAELSKESPDSVYLLRLSKEVGDLQSGLTMLTVRHFMQLKKNCTPGQREILLTMYYDIFGCKRGIGIQNRNPYGTNDTCSGMPCK